MSKLGKLSWVRGIVFVLMVVMAFLIYAPTKDFLARIPTISRVQEKVKANGFTEVLVSEPDMSKAHRYCPDGSIYYDVWARTPEANGVDLYVCTDGEQYTVSYP